MPLVVSVYSLFHVFRIIPELCFYFCLASNFKLPMPIVLLLFLFSMWLRAHLFQYNHITCFMFAYNFQSINTLRKRKSRHKSRRSNSRKSKKQIKRNEFQPFCKTESLDQSLEIKVKLSTSSFACFCWSVLRKFISIHESRIAARVCLNVTSLPTKFHQKRT